MDIQKIKETTLKVYKDCDIKSFPVSCTNILSDYHFKLYSYSFLREQNEELHQMCRKFSNDAFTYGNNICYNDDMPKERIRFSLMHELGHFLLKSDSETAANQFASYVLAPRCILQKSGYTSIPETVKLFQISKEAASYVIKDLEVYEKLSPVDNQILEHFYNDELHIYIYRKSECPICGSTIYNSLKDTCIQCKKLSIKSR